MHKKPRDLRRKELEWINENVLRPLAERVCEQLESEILYGTKRVVPERLPIGLKKEGAK